MARRPRPAGDFCLRPVRCSWPVPALRSGLVQPENRATVGRFNSTSPGPAYVLVQHAQAVVPAGDPLDGTSPGMPLRWRQTGGAGPSPQNTVANCVPGEKDESIMRETRRAWIKLFFGGRKNLAVIPAKRRSRTEPGPIEKRDRAA